MPSIQTNIVPTVLRVLIQATQHKDNSPPWAYLLPLLFRVLHRAQALPFSTPWYSEVLHGAPTHVIVSYCINSCGKNSNHMSYTWASLGCILVLSWTRGNMYLLYIYVNMYLLYILLFSFTCTKCLSYHLVACSHGTLVPIMALYIISITMSLLHTLLHE